MQENKMTKNDKKIHNNAIDFSIGFFLIPFIIFIAKTSVFIVLRPALITDAIAIIFVALLTGLYFVLSKKTIFHFGEEVRSMRYKNYGGLTFFTLFILLGLIQEMNFKDIIASIVK